MSNIRNWPFEYQENTACLVSSNVISGKDILYVWHYSSTSTFIFLDSETIDENSIKVVGLNTVLNNDPTISSIAKLKPGWKASRSYIGDSWHIETFVEPTD